MAKHTSNLELRGRSYYYRVSFTLNRKTFALRLSLETADPVVARERCSRMDLALKRRWREVVASPIPMTEDDKQSIMRAAALGARRSLQQIEAGCLDTSYEASDEGRYDYLSSLRGLQTIVRDVFLHGVHRNFGSREYEMHLLDGSPTIGREELGRLREIIAGGAEIAAGFREGADEALRRRNVDQTPANLTLATREIAKGTLLALREAIATAQDPTRALDTMLAALEMPEEPPTSRRAEVRPAAAVQPANIEPRVEAGARVVAPPAEPGVPGMSIREAADAFLATHPRYDDDSADSVWTTKTRSQFEAAIFLAHKFLGDAAVVGIDEETLAELVRALRRLPANHHKTPAHAPLTLWEIAERGVGTTLGIATTNRHVRFIRLVLDWAWKRASAPPKVDWSAFITADRRLKRNKRPAFTASELETLFGGAVWTGAESRVRRAKPGRYLVWDSAYWVPILLAYSGARREEIAKLEVIDIEATDGIWALKIRINAGGRIKNAASERDIPLADAVLKLGFLSFVERQRDAGELFLFPELRRAAGNMGDYFYKRWWRMFERAGLVPPGKDIHSIRHYVSTTLAAAEVSEERRADLLGHTLLSETAGTYTKRTPLWILRDVVNRLPVVTADLSVVRQDGPA